MISKQGENPLWDYFKISNKDVSIAVCILCKENLSRGSKDPHKMTTTTNLCQSQMLMNKHVYLLQNSIEVIKFILTFLVFV